MAIFRITKSAIEAVPPTTFSRHGVRERTDLQRLLRSNIAVVAPDVLVIAEEFGEWEDSRRRIDLLGVDTDANLVVLELKRDDDGGHMELQAVRYAAMVSGMTFARAAEVYQGFLDGQGGGADARKQLLEHLEWQEPQEEEFGRDVRIVLVAADFSKEITTAVMWLNARDLDIRCVRVKPYAMGQEILVDVQQVVPLPEAAEYTVQLRQKGQAVRHEMAERDLLRVDFWRELIPATTEVAPRFSGIKPSGDHWLAATAGVPGFAWHYLIWTSQAGAKLYIDRGLGGERFNKAAFDYLAEHRNEIERAYQSALVWDRMDGKRASAVYEESIPGGIRSPREEWPRIRGAMIDAMRRLQLALGPHLQGAAAHANSSTA